jgi:hypothetical protein
MVGHTGALLSSVPMRWIVFLVTITALANDSEVSYYINSGAALVTYITSKT